MKKLPVFEALIADYDEGILNISLVDEPAVESNFLAFNKEKEPLKFAIEDEEQRIIYGVLMRADYLIYRYNEKIGEYYIKYSKDTIKQMAEKLLLDNKQNSVNLMHLDNSNVTGVNLMQIFIKDSENGLNPKGFEDIEEGSLFAQFKVENDDIWNAVKEGTFKGFSIEGLFQMEEKFNKQNKKRMSMSKLKEQLKKLLQEFASVATDKGEVFYEGELAVGVEVFDENDNALADGEYATEDKIIVVAEGKVTEIREKVVEEEPVEAPAVEQFKAKCKQKFESYEEIEKKIADAIRAMGIEDFWLVEAGEDYAVVSVWEEDKEVFYRYDVVMEGEEIRVENPQEVVSKFVPVEKAAEVAEEVVEEEVEAGCKKKKQKFEEAPAAEAPAEEEMDVKAEIDALKAEIEKLKESIAAISNTPMVEPVAEEFENITKISKTGNRQLDNLINLLNA